MILVIMLGLQIVPMIIYEITKSIWCLRHFKRNVYESREAFDGGIPIRWCEQCKKESNYNTDKCWRKL